MGSWVVSTLGYVLLAFPECLSVCVNWTREALPRSPEGLSPVIPSHGQVTQSCLPRLIVLGGGTGHPHCAAPLPLPTLIATLPLARLQPEKVLVTLIHKALPLP